MAKRIALKSIILCWISRPSCYVEVRIVLITIAIYISAFSFHLAYFVARLVVHEAYFHRSRPASGSSYSLLDLAVTKRAPSVIVQWICSRGTNPQLSDYCAKEWEMIAADMPHINWLSCPEGTPFIHVRRTAAGTLNLTQRWQRQ